MKRDNMDELDKTTHHFDRTTKEESRYFYFIFTVEWG